MSTTVLPAERPAPTPASPNSTASTSGVSGTMMNTMSARCATSVAFLQTTALPEAMSAGTGPCVKTESSWPAASRWPAMGAPMMPRPMNPSCMIVPSRMGSAAAHLGEHLLGAGGHQARVGADGDELEALGRARQRGLRRAVVDGGDDAVRLGALQDVVDGLRHRRVDVVEGRLAAERERQVRRPDVDRVQALDGQDGVEVVERLRGLDHREGDDGVVGVLRVVGAAVEQRAHRAEAARA